MVRISGQSWNAADGDPLGRRFAVDGTLDVEQRIDPAHGGQRHRRDERSRLALRAAPGVLGPVRQAANASGLRRGLQPVTDTQGAAESVAPPASPKPPLSTSGRGIGPLLERMLDRQAATGLPPAYLPKDEGDDA